jgi:hypothetical protein
MAMEIEGAMTEAKATKTTFVYDNQTGEVVHVHQFIPASPGGTCSEREMEETALALAPTALDRAQLGVLHHDEELDLEPEYHYRIDVEAGRLVADRAPNKSPQGRERDSRTTRG